MEAFLPCCAACVSMFFFLRLTAQLKVIGTESCLLRSPCSLFFVLIMSVANMHQLAQVASLIVQGRNVPWAMKRIKGIVYSRQRVEVLLSEHVELSIVDAEPSGVVFLLHKCHRGRPRTLADGSIKSLASTLLTSA